MHGGVDVPVTALSRELVLALELGFQKASMCM